MHLDDRKFLLYLNNLIDVLLEGLICFPVLPLIQFYCLLKASDVFHEWNICFFRLLILPDRVIRHPLESCNILSIKLICHKQAVSMLKLYWSREFVLRIEFVFYCRKLFEFLVWFYKTNSISFVRRHVHNELHIVFIFSLLEYKS